MNSIKLWKLVSGREPFGIRPFSATVRPTAETEKWIIETTSALQEERYIDGRPISSAEVQFHCKIEMENEPCF